MNELEQLKRQRAELDAKIKDLEAAQLWPPVDGQWAHCLAADGAVATIEFSGSYALELAQGNLATFNETGQTWLKATSAWRNALNESQSTGFNRGDECWIFLDHNGDTQRSQYLVCEGSFVVYRRTRAESKADWENWGKRLAQGRGF